MIRGFACGPAGETSGPCRESRMGVVWAAALSAVGLDLLRLRTAAFRERLALAAEVLILRTQVATLVERLGRGTDRERAAHQARAPSVAAVGSEVHAQTSRRTRTPRSRRSAVGDVRSQPRRRDRGVLGLTDGKKRPDEEQSDHLDVGLEALGLSFETGNQLVDEAGLVEHRFDSLDVSAVVHFVPPSRNSWTSLRAGRYWSMS